jgi:Ca2+-binding EF-hand superfamily protein
MRAALCLFCAALAGGSVRAGEEQDRHEDQAVTRCAQHKAQRSIQVERWERAQTVRELEAAYPGKLTKSEPGKNENEGADWFALVAGTGDEWRKADAVAAGLGPMFERWKGRLELGPVPSIKRDEFIRFSKLIIANAAAGLNEGGPDTNGEADKVFRILDLNGDGQLTGKELTAGLDEDKAQADGDGDGRISKDEYREYFRRRVEKRADTLTTAFKANDALMRELEGTGKRGGLPEWFAKLDQNKDGQVSLFEWRKGGRPTETFQDMDLNGDGLLTADEYVRWAKQKASAEARKKRDEEDKKRDERQR